MPLFLINERMPDCGNKTVLSTKPDAFVIILPQCLFQCCTNAAMQQCGNLPAGSSVLDTQACERANGGFSLNLETITPVSYYSPLTPVPHFPNLRTQIVHTRRHKHLKQPLLVMHLYTARHCWRHMFLIRLNAIVMDCWVSQWQWYVVTGLVNPSHHRQCMLCLWRNMSLIICIVYMRLQHCCPQCAVIQRKKGFATPAARKQ